MLLRFAFAQPLAALGQPVDLALTRDTITLFEGSLRAAELRLRAGDIATADVARLDVDALRAQNDAHAAQADRRRAPFAPEYMIGAEADTMKPRCIRILPEKLCCS